MNYTENVTELPVHAQTADTRCSSLPTECLGTRLYHGIQMKERKYYTFIWYIITIHTDHSGANPSFISHSSPSKLACYNCMHSLLHHQLLIVYSILHTASNQNLEV